MSELPTTCPDGELVLHEGRPNNLPPNLRTPTASSVDIGLLRMREGLPTVDLILGGRPPSSALDLHVGDTFAWGTGSFEVLGICASSVSLRVLPAAKAGPTEDAG